MAITLAQRPIVGSGETEAFFVDFSAALDHIDGTLRSATATTAVLEWDASATDDTYNSRVLIIEDGTGKGQWATISDYTGSSRTCTVSTWGATPDASSKYRVTEILTGTPTVAEVTTAALTLASKAINTVPVHLDDLESGRVSYPGCGVQWTCSGQQTGTEYTIRITATTNGSPARTLVRDARFTVSQ